MRCSRWLQLAQSLFPVGGLLWGAEDFFFLSACVPTTPTCSRVSSPQTLWSRLWWCTEGCRRKGREVPQCKKKSVVQVVWQTWIHPVRLSLKKLIHDLTMPGLMLRCYGYKSLCLVIYVSFLKGKKNSPIWKGKEAHNSPYSRAPTISHLCSVRMA